MKKNKSLKALQKNGAFSLKNTWKSDLLSGFMVFLLALPLSLGIAKASGFPASMGVLTAIIGGIFTSLFKVSELTIKGPAAGLITICSGAILEFGGGDQGWKMVTAIIMVAALLQICFGLLKLGSLSDFFPHSAIHGMLAAIGIIIIVKQIPVLLGDDPTLYKGEGPIELILDIPNFISHAHWHIAAIGIIGLIIMFTLPRIGIKFIKKLPAPMLVLLLAIPLTFYWHFEKTEPSYSLVSIGDFWGTLGFNFDFSGIQTFAFWKYVFMFLFVNSIESLLTVKAVDNLDPYKRVSNYNGDLKGVGAGNFLSASLGGLPMISEVVRSSANIGFGAKTKWSNIFHGIFLLLAMLLIIPLIELIPNAALAAMLIFAGYRLASPKEFRHISKIGKEQLAIFLATIIITLFEDLLLGIAVGILIKFIFHVYHGAKFNNLFIARYEHTNSENEIRVTVLQSAIFSNLIGFKKLLEGLPEKSKIIFDLSKTQLIDHSFMAFLSHFEKEYNLAGGDFKIIGTNKHISFSDHPLATKKLKKIKSSKA